MPHHLQIGSIVVCDAFDRIAEIMPSCIKLPVVADADRHGMAANINDHGVRLYQMDETNIPEVVRHLVEETRPAAPVGVHIVEIAQAEAFEHRRIEFAQKLRVAHALLRSELSDDARNVVKLLRSVDLGV